VKERERRQIVEVTDRVRSDERKDKMKLKRKRKSETDRREEREKVRGK